MGNVDMESGNERFFVLLVQMLACVLQANDTAGYPNGRLHTFTA